MSYIISDYSVINILRPASKKLSLSKLCYILEKTSSRVANGNEIMPIYRNLDR